MDVLLPKEVENLPEILDKGYQLIEIDGMKRNKVATFDYKNINLFTNKPFFIISLYYLKTYLIDNDKEYLALKIQNYVEEEEKKFEKRLYWSDNNVTRIPITLIVSDNIVVYFKLLLTLNVNPKEIFE
jgi:hypothetical protein